jgi:hypothetical protein
MRRHTLQSVLLLLTLGTVLLATGCGNDAGGGTGPSASATGAVSSAQPSVAGSAAAAGSQGRTAADAVAAVYFDPKATVCRAVFFDDGRYQYWDGAQVMQGTYKVDTQAGTVATEALGTLSWDAKTGRLKSSMYDLARLSGSANDLAKHAAGRTWDDLDKSLQASDTEVNAAIDDWLANEGAQPPASSPPPTVTRDEVAGTYSDGSAFDLTLVRDGTWKQGQGLSFRHGLYQLWGATITLTGDPADDSADGMDEEFTFDKTTDALTDQSSHVWHRIPTPTPTDYGPM